jgi:hypothetical protein
MLKVDITVGGLDPVVYQHILRLYFFLLRAAGWYGTRRTFRYLYSCDVVVVVAGMKRERVFPSIAVTGCVLCAARPGAAAAALHYSIWTDPHIYTHWDTGKRL